MYVTGQYGVLMMTVDGDYHRTGGFSTEQAAREFANYLWKKPTTEEVEIYRHSFYKKRRHSVVIAKATKNKK